MKHVLRSFWFFAAIIHVAAATAPLWDPEFTEVGISYRVVFSAGCIAMALWCFRWAGE
jgi:hypothetical protein